MRMQCKTTSTIDDDNFINITQNCTSIDCNNDIINEMINETDCTEGPLPFFHIVEHICNAWFTFELLTRLIVSI